MIKESAIFRVAKALAKEATVKKIELKLFLMKLEEKVAVPKRSPYQAKNDVETISLSTP